MNLFQRLLYRRLCTEQPADGGSPPAASEPAVPVVPGAETPPEATEPETVIKPGDEEKPDPTKPDPGKEQKPEGAPEKYEFAAGEGIELDGTAIEAFEPVARELNLTNEQAQKLVDMYPKIIASQEQRQAEAWQQQTEQWAADVKADKDIGGDKLPANLGAAQRAIDQFGSPELKEYLNGTGLGNNPELVRFCVKVGKAMSEDSMVDAGNSGQRSAAEVLYGK